MNPYSGFSNTRDAERQVKIGLHQWSKRDENIYNDLNPDGTSRYQDQNAPPAKEPSGLYRAMHAGSGISGTASELAHQKKEEIKEAGEKLLHIAIMFSALYIIIEFIKSKKK